MKFILSTNDLNRNGYIVRVDGIDLTDFYNNPVMLFDHDSSKVIGRWEDVKLEMMRIGETEQQCLTGYAVFDETDAESKKILNKVTDGFIKGCSIGFTALDMYERADGIVEISKSSLFEASIVAIPANTKTWKQSVKMFDTDMNVITNEIEFFTNSLKNKNINMTEEIKTPETDVVENEILENKVDNVIVETIEETILENKVEDIVVDNVVVDTVDVVEAPVVEIPVVETKEDSLQLRINKMFSLTDDTDTKILLSLHKVKEENFTLSAKIGELEKQLETFKIETAKEKYNDAVNKAIKEGRINNTQLDSLNKMKEIDLNSTIEFINNIKPVTSLKNMVDNTVVDAKELSFTEMSKTQPDKLYSLKINNPDEYQRIYDKEFKK